MCCSQLAQKVSASVYTSLCLPMSFIVAAERGKWIKQCPPSHRPLLWCAGTCSCRSQSLLSDTAELVNSCTSSVRIRSSRLCWLSEVSDVGQGVVTAGGRPAQCSAHHSFFGLSDQVSRLDCYDNSKLALKSPEASRLSLWWLYIGAVQLRQRARVILFPIRRSPKGS